MPSGFGGKNIIVMITNDCHQPGHPEQREARYFAWSNSYRLRALIGKMLYLARGSAKRAREVLSKIQKLLLVVENCLI